MVDFFDLSWVEVISSNITIFIRSSQSSERNETKTFLHLGPESGHQIFESRYGEIDSRTNQILIFFKDEFEKLGFFVLILYEN